MDKTKGKEGERLDSFDIDLDSGSDVSEFVKIDTPKLDMEKFTATIKSRKLLDTHVPPDLRPRDHTSWSRQQLTKGGK